MRGLVVAMERANKSSANYTNCGVVVHYHPKQAVMSVPLDATAYAGRVTVGAAVYLRVISYITDTVTALSGHRIPRMDLLHRPISGQHYSRPRSWMVQHRVQCGVNRDQSWEERTGVRYRVRKL